MRRESAGDTCRRLRLRSFAKRAWHPQRIARPTGQLGTTSTVHTTNSNSPENIPELSDAGVAKNMNTSDNPQSTVHVQYAHFIPLTV